MHDGTARGCNSAFGAHLSLSSPPWTLGMAMPNKRGRRKGTLPLLSLQSMEHFISSMDRPDIAYSKVTHATKSLHLSACFLSILWSLPNWICHFQLAKIIPLVCQESVSSRTPSISSCGTNVQRIKFRSTMVTWSVFFEERD